MKLSEKAKSLGIRQDMLDTALVSAGNPAKIAAVMRKAAAGQRITIGVIGGSVTHGASATVKENSYAGILRKWWEHTFPASTISYINAGYSGTSSLLGVHRVNEFLLDHNPDFVLVEFAVNDIIQEFQAECYASLVHKILSAPCAPAVMTLFVMNNGGINAQADQQPICAHYDLPMISYRDAVWPEVKTEQNPDGQYLWEEICADWVHPTDKGHAIVGELVTTYLNDVYEALDTITTDLPAIPEPYQPYVYENAKWYHCENTEPVSMGSFKVFTKECCSWQNEGEEPLVIKATGKRIVLPICTPYSDDLKMTVKVDGVEKSLPEYVIRGGIFTNFIILDDAEAGEHIVEIIPNGDTVWCGGLLVS